jgi:hypothetical protein
MNFADPSHQDPSTPTRPNANGSRENVNPRRHAGAKAMTTCRSLEQNSCVTTRSNPYEWANRPRRVAMTGQVLSRWQARRMSRSFAGAGVAIPPARLRQIAAGAAVANDELTDVNFALAATQIVREQRHARFERRRRHGTRCLLFVGLVLVVLNFLICMAYVMLSVIQHASSL